MARSNRRTFWQENAKAGAIGALVIGLGGLGYFLNNLPWASQKDLTQLAQAEQQQRSELRDQLKETRQDIKTNNEATQRAFDRVLEKLQTLEVNQAVNQQQRIVQPPQMISVPPPPPMR